MGHFSVSEMIKSDQIVSLTTTERCFQPDYRATRRAVACQPAKRLIGEGLQAVGHVCMTEEYIRVLINVFSLTAVYLVEAGPENFFLEMAF